MAVNNSMFYHFFLALYDRDVRKICQSHASALKLSKKRETEAFRGQTLPYKLPQCQPFFFESEEY